MPLAEAFEDERYESKAMSVGSASALVAGTTVGAGVLALPAATSSAGFVASSAVLIGSWAFMAVAALLVAETSVAVICSTGRADLGFLATVEALLGSRVGQIGGVFYAFIHYALLVAYAAQGGSLLGTALGLDPQTGSVAFVALLGGSVAFGSETFVDRLNNAFVACVLAAFSALLVFGSAAFDASRLFGPTPDPGVAFSAVPISILSLVYHNVVPLVATRLRGDRTKIARAIIFGSAVPLVMFLCWNGLVLGAVDADAVASTGGDPVAALVSADPDEAGELGPAIALFSFSAIVTSFVGFYYGLRVYLKDLLISTGQASGLAQNEAALAAGVLAPPTALALVKPDIFLPALDAAGSFGITTLFGIIPAACAWKLRSKDTGRDDLAFVPGGDLTLGLVAALCSVIIVEGLLDAAGAI